jgi:hypothetical protein
VESKEEELEQLSILETQFNNLTWNTSKKWNHFLQNPAS